MELGLEGRGLSPIPGSGCQESSPLNNPLAECRCARLAHLLINDAGGFVLANVVGHLLRSYFLWTDVVRRCRSVTRRV